MPRRRDSPEAWVAVSIDMVSTIKTQKGILMREFKGWILLIDEATFLGVCCDAPHRLCDLERRTEAKHPCRLL
jgi:hypothetical protein